MHADWIDLFGISAENKVRYLVVGGYAVAFHGFERYTKDLDIWIERTPDNAEAVKRSLITFGTASNDARAADFLDPKKVFVMGLAPFRVDIITELEALDFAKAWSRRLTRPRDGVEIHYVAKRDLITLKKAADRFLDWRDIGAIGGRYYRRLADERMGERVGKRDAEEVLEPVRSPDRQTKKRKAKLPKPKARR